MGTREKVQELMQAGERAAEIARTLGVSKATVSYHVNLLGLGSGPRTKHDWSAIREHYEAGNSAASTIRHFGLSTAVWYFSVDKGRITLRDRLVPLESLLVVGGARSCRGTLKRRLLEEGLLEYRCAADECSLTEWLGRPIALQLDHINGDPCDHRIENLRLLCPNCHSQTDTWGRKARTAA